MNPPQKPVINNKGSHDGTFGCRITIPPKSPMSKQPNMLTAKVAQGNPVPAYRMSRETAYLADPPKKLPTPTMRISLIIIKCFINSHHVLRPPEKASTLPSSQPLYNPINAKDASDRSRAMGKDNIILRELRKISPKLSTRNYHSHKQHSPFINYENSTPMPLFKY